MQTLVCLKHLKHRDIVGLVAAVALMLYPTGALAQRAPTPLPAREVQPEGAGARGTAYDDLDEYIASEEYLLSYLFNRNWDENAPPAIELLWDDADPSTDSMVLGSTEEPGTLSVELVRYVGDGEDPPYQDYVVVGQGTFVEAARFEYLAFTLVVDDGVAVDAEVIAGVLTPEIGVPRVLWGIEQATTFSDVETGDEWLVRSFMPLYVLDTLDQAVPDAYAFSKVVPATTGDGSGKAGKDAVSAIGPVLMYAPGGPDGPGGRGMHPCMLKAQGEWEMAQVRMVIMVAACGTVVATTAATVCPKCVVCTLPWAVAACFVGCVAVAFVASVVCVRVAESWYAGRIKVIRADMVLCCQQSGGCPPLE